jgi:SAM-dependent methyltransferase
MRSGTLVAAVELGLFDVLAKGALPVNEIADLIGLTDDRADKLISAAASLDLVVRAGDKITNTPETDRFLVTGKDTYFGDYLTHLAKGSYASWGNLAERLVHRFDFSGCRHLLDLGGGSAVYSIEACRRNPNLTATVLDFENVCVVAREFIEQAGLRDRIEARALDFTRDDLPAGADAVLLCGNIHAYDEETARRVVANAYKALPAGGVMIICDYMLDDDRAGPPVAAFISVSQAFSGGRGRVHSGADFASYLSDAGFSVDKVKEFLAGSMGWATATKPAD